MKKIPARFSQWPARAGFFIWCALALFVEPAHAQSPQLGAGQVLGNTTASQRPAQAVGLSALFDRAFCSTANSALARVSGSWACLATANNAIWATNGSGVPALTQTLPSAVQDNITRLSTIVSGAWAATPIPINKGGSNATDAASARANFGLGSIATQDANNVTLAGALTGLPTPTLSSDATPKWYVDSFSGGVKPRTAVKWATAAVLPNTPTYANGASGVGATLTAGSNAAIVVDGGSPALNDRVLVRNQASTLQNGVYTVTTVGSGAAAWVLTRATDFDAPAEMIAGAGFLVEAGSTNIGTGWALDATIATVGTDAVNFNKYQSISGALLAASNLSDVANPSTARTNLGLAIGTNVQAFDSDLSALAANGTNGFWARTGAGTGSARTITGTANQITVSNGDGVSGNPTLSLPSALILPGTLSATNITASGNLTVSGATTVLGAASSFGLAGLEVKAATDEHAIVTGHNTLSTGLSIRSVNDANNAYKPIEFIGNQFLFSVGNVGINTGATAPAHTLDVNGNIGVPSNGYFNFGATNGSGGEGFRNLAGTIQVSTGPGAWVNIPTSSATQWTTSGLNIYFNTGAVLVGTTTAKTGSSLDVVGGSTYLAVTNPTMREANCWGFPANCETGGLISLVTYTGAVTGGSAIRGEASRDNVASVIGGVAGTARAVNSNGDIVGVLGSVLFLGGGTGYGGWFFNYICAPGSVEAQCSGGTGAAVGDTGLIAGQNRGEVAPKYGLLLSKEGNAEVLGVGCCVNGVLLTDFIEKGFWAYNNKGAAWGFYQDDGSTQNFGVDSAGSVLAHQIAFNSGSGTNVPLCYNTTDRAFYATVVGCTSDRRLKNELGPLPDGALQIVAQMKPSRFALKSDPSQRVNAGFYAQDLQPIAPEAVIVGMDGDHLQLIDSALIAYVVKAIQELDARTPK